MTLLRRMIEHMKARNWLAVFLDFVIVVVFNGFRSPAGPVRRDQ